VSGGQTILLAFILETDARPRWLADGEGPLYREPADV
jgi:hypothetical protein